MPEARGKDVAPMTKEDLDAMFHEAVRIGTDVVFTLDIPCDPTKPGRFRKKRNEKLKR